MFAVVDKQAPSQDVPADENLVSLMRDIDFDHRYGQFGDMNLWLQEDEANVVLQTWLRVGAC